MSFKLTFRTKARHDIEDIKLYYQNISQKLLDRFSQEFYEAISHVTNEPLLYQVRHRDTHIATLHRFPYSIHYQIKKDTVIILRVLHSSRYYE